MPKRIFFIFLIFVFIFPASSCLGVDTRLDKKDLTSGLSVEKRIEKARNASYTIIKINLYGDKKDVDLGMVSVGIGRGVVFKDNGKLIVLSAGHVIFSPEFDEDLYKFLLAEKLNFLNVNDFDFDFDWKIGRRVAIWSTPRNLGEWYREGIVSSDYTNFSRTKKDYNFGIIDVFCAPGDSGGIVISCDSGKIIGLPISLSSVFPLGIIVKIDKFFDGLNLKKE